MKEDQGDNDNDDDNDDDDMYAGSMDQDEPR
jgi:hypothetical protein